MIKLKHILLPTDFSECSAAAVPYACAFAERFDAELHLLHVVEDLAASLPESIVELAESSESMEEYLERYLDEAETRALANLGTVLQEDWSRGKRIVRSTRFGSRFLKIVEYTKDNGIDLIVMATHGRSGLSHALLGSVTEKVVRYAPCPVLTVRPEGHQFVMP